MTEKTLFCVLLASAISTAVSAQEYNQITDDGIYTPAGQQDAFGGRRDSTKPKEKIVPRGLKVWTVDERFGDRSMAQPDTLSHLFQNSIFTTGIRGEYNTLGNLGSPRLSRIFIDRMQGEQFLFTQPYDYFVKPVGQYFFTNTLSPITNLTYNECGDRTNGEDHLKAMFGVNIGKDLGVGFNFDYIYGRGYYQSQSTSHFNYSLHASYLGERYNAHFLFSTNHEKVTENGGITDDRYITHPEVFNDNFNEDEIPTVLEQNWNRNDNQHIFFSHRYNVGFRRKVKMTDEEIKARQFAIESKKENEASRKEEEARRKGEANDKEKGKMEKTFVGRPVNSVIAGDEPGESQKADTERTKINGKAQADSISSIAAKAAETEKWMKEEYVPVTSFIHTMKFDNYKRIYQAYQTPENFYADNYDMDLKFGGDSIYDKTSHYSLKNTLGIAMLEGFNKWAKAGLKIFATSELRHFTLPKQTAGTDSYNEHTLSVGAQLSKTEGKTVHYNATAETWVMGEDAGQLKMEGNADLNFKLFGDTVQLAASAYFMRLNQTFYYRHYHSRHYWWDNSLDKELRTRVEGTLSIRHTRTRLRVAFDGLKNYTYMSQSYTITDDFGRTGNTVSVKQHSGNITLLTAQLFQDFAFGPVHWENCLTYQKSSNDNILPVPTFNAYSNLYLRFKIAKVLKVDLGADVRYFSKYYAPDYSPALGQFTVQDNGENNVKTGNYPIINVYANMHIKQTRFFIMMSHINAGNGEYFLTPHYPLNSRVLRFGLSWNFFN